MKRVKISKPNTTYRYYRKRLYKRYSDDSLKTSHICLNCGHEFTGDYCNICGQKANVQRITGKTVWHGILKGLFYLDHNFFYTILALFLRPNTYIKGFLQGKRIGRIYPFQLLFVLAAIYGMFLYIFYPDTITGSSDNTMGVFVNHLKEGATGMEGIINRIVHFFDKNSAFTSVLIMPLYALATRWAFHKKYKEDYDFNFWELINVRAYISSMILVVSIIRLPFDNRSSLFVSLLITFWVYIQLFGEKKWRTFWHICLMYLYLILQILIITIIIMAIVVLIGLIFYGKVMV